VPWLFLCFALIAGIAVALQPVMNAAAAANMGHPILGALASATVTFVILAVAALLLRLPLPAMGVLRGFPFWLYGGGLVGALMLFTALLAAPNLGVVTTVAAIIAGQLAAALLIDHYGWLGIPEHPVNLPRIVGAVCLLAGVVLVRNF
jgi:transporter family-2 protein